MTDATEYSYEDYYSSAINALLGTSFPVRMIQPLMQRASEFTHLYGNCLGKVGALNSCIIGFDGEVVTVDMAEYKRQNVGGDCVQVTGRFIESLTWEARRAAQVSGSHDLGTTMAVQNVSITRIECYAPWFFKERNGYVHTACLLGVDDAEILVDPSFGVVLDAKQAERYGYRVLRDNNMVLNWLNQIIITGNEQDLPVYEYAESGLTKSGRGMILGTDDELMVAYSLGFMRDTHLRLLYPFIQAISPEGDSFYTFNTVRDLLTFDYGFLRQIEDDPSSANLMNNVVGFLQALPMLTY